MLSHARENEFSGVNKILLERLKPPVTCQFQSIFFSLTRYAG
jgi:hypothetical protein